MHRISANQVPDLPEGIVDEHNYRIGPQKLQNRSSMVVHRPYIQYISIINNEKIIA
jgi:hypothetical protein